MFPRALFTCVAGVALVLAAACGGDSSPEPTASPVVSAVPSSVPIDLALADRLVVEGDSNGAIEIYSAAVLRGTEEEQQHGLWELARLQFEQGEEGDAAKNAEALIAKGPEDDARERRAYLLLGYSKFAQGRMEEAKEALEKYIRLGGPATPYAQIKLAEIASADGNHGDAVRGAEAVLGAELPAAQATAVMFSLARYQEAAEDIQGAFATLQTITEDAESAEDVVEALWETARLAEGTGDLQRQQDALRSIIVNYPSYDRALEALTPSEQTSLQERALVLYRHQENESARQAYETLVTDPDPGIVGDAQYRLAILAERAGNPAGALEHYGAAIGALAPVGGPLLDAAYWDRGLLLEALGRPEEAVADYAALADNPQTGDHTGDALQRAGMIRYKQALPGEAAAFWERNIGRTFDAEEQAQTHFWLARAYTDMGDTAQAQSHLEEAVTSDSYYGLRAEALLGGHTLAADAPAVESPPPDWAAVEAWLTSVVGPETPSTGTPEPTPDFFASPEWLRAEEVMEVGLVDPAIDELRTLINGEDSAWVQYRLARRLSEEGYVRNATLAASTLLGYENPPRELLRIAYPAKYVSQLNAAAAEQGVPPALLMALVRQESFFDASATSVVGALGLTQVMPATGENIAAQLGVEGYTQGDLLNPDVNARFGAYYLATQIEGFGGNIGAALAAYNGGPGNAARWTETTGNDIDLLVETVDFDETRTYLEHVLANYAFYRYAYGVSDTLSLPLE